MRRKIKRLIAKLSLTLSAILICFSVCEVLARIIYKNKIGLFPRYQTDVQYGEYRLRRMRPNSEFWHRSADGKWKFKINKQGFRSDNDFSYEKQSGALRILVLGDSYTEGVEVRQDYTYSAIIEKYLNANGARSEVFNTGISGFSTAEELIFLENEGIKYQPDIVLLGFYANDFEDNIKTNLFSINKGELIVTNKKYIPGVRIQNIIYRISFIRFLSENSYFYSLLFNSIWDYFKGIVYKNRTGDIVAEYAVPIGKVNDYQIQLGMKLLGRMHVFCKSKKIIFIILDIPNFGNKSFPQEVQAVAKRSCDLLIDGAEVLNACKGVGETNVPHGQRHLTELSHMLIGMETGKEILNVIRWCNRCAVGGLH